MSSAGPDVKRPPQVAWDLRDFVLEVDLAMVEADGG
jgi:hypothetical protein